MIILFDMDGTLIDSKDAIISSFLASFKECGDLKASKKEIKNLIGYPLAIMYKKLGSPNELIDKYLNSYKNNYLKVYKEKTKLLKGSKKAIINASKFAKLGIVTTKTSRRTTELLEYFKLIKYFSTIIGMEDVKNPKPHKEPILKALKNLKIKNKNNVWMIGDTLLDIKSAKRAKIKCIALTCGYEKNKLLKKHCKIIKNNPNQAVKFLKKL